MGTRHGHQGGARVWVALIGAALAAAICPASAAAAPPASFSSAAVYGTHTGPSAIAVLDVKGDGHQDIAVANNQSNDVTVLLSDGAGAFSSLGNLVGFNHPSALTVGDFNEDGFQDFAAANEGSTGANGVTIELGSASGFSSSSTASAHTGPAAIAAGDFNGDGHLDLAVGNGNSNDVSVLLGSGNGSFGAPTNFAVHASPASIAVGDFNRDGHEDLAVANGGSFTTASTNDVSVLLGTGTGSLFGAATNFGAGVRPVAVAVGDFNEDGKQDLAVGNGNSDPSVLLGTGNGSFGAATSFPGGNLTTGLVVGDFNGDGHQDLALSNVNGPGVSVLLGTGSGTFSGATPFSTNAFAPVGLAVGDFNGDGRGDLTVAGQNQSNGTASVLLNTAHFPAVSQLGSPTPSTIGLPEDVAVSPEKSGSVSNVYVGSPSGLLAFSRDPATGALTPIAAPSSPRGLTGAVDGNVTVSPDGKSVYMATGHAVLVFARDTSTGTLTQLPLTAGCINGDGTDGCATSRSGASFVPDLVRFGPEASGSTAYVVGPPNNVGTVLSIFSRNTSTGALTQASTAAGCISATGLDGNGGPCQKVDELGNEADIAFSADGSRAYVASSSEATIVAFARDTASGALTPLSGTARCVVDADSASNWPGCKPGRALGGIEREALVGDNLYVTNTNGTAHGVAEFAISAATGGLSQLTGANGCLTTTGDDGESSHGACTQARVTNGAGDLGGPRAIVASPDGLDVYVVGEDNGDLVTLARDLSSGALHDTACVGANSADPGCTQGSGMSNLGGLAISPDGRHLYGAGDNVTAFTRRAPGFTVAGSASPASGGTVAGSTSSANSSCSGSSCTIDSGGSATLTATAASGFRFTGWSGACTGTTNPCTIDNVTSDRSATANFVARVTVTGSPNPAAGGSVTASDSSASASCAGASCTVDSGDTVTLTAAAASGYRFTGWQGPCAGSSSGTTCTVTNATSDTGATASFVRRVTVTGAASPASDGTVHASSPSPNASCDNPVTGVCTVDSGDQVTLTATATSGHTFKGWTGACSGTNPTCTIAHAASDLTATASFGNEAAAGTTSTSGSSTVVVTPKGTFKTGITVECGKPCQLAAGAKATVPGKKKASAAAAGKLTLTVASFSRTLGAGKHVKLVMRLNHKGFGLLRKLHRMVIRVDVRVSAKNARTVKTHRTLKLKLAKHP